MDLPLPLSLGLGDQLLIKEFEGLLDCVIQLLADPAVIRIQ